MIKSKLVSKNKTYKYVFFFKIQWVPIYLIFLAVVFYLPRCLWLVMEGGLMKFFGKGTTHRLVEEPEEKRDKLVKVCIFKTTKSFL